MTMVRSTDSDQTKLALIQQSLTTINGSMTEMKADLKEIKNSHLPITVYNDFKIEYEKKIVELVANLEKCVSKEEFSDMKKTYNLVGTAIILAVLGAIFKLIFIH